MLYRLLCHNLIQNKRLLNSQSKISSRESVTKQTPDVTCQSNNYWIIHWAPKTCKRISRSHQEFFFTSCGTPTRVASISDYFEKLFRPQINKILQQWQSNGEYIANKLYEAILLLEGSNYWSIWSDTESQQLLHNGRRWYSLSTLKLSLGKLLSVVSNP